MFRPFEDNVLPNQQQTLILKACLLDAPDEARVAYFEWRKQQNLDDLDNGSFRLIPLLWRRATALNWGSDEDEGRLRGIYRYQWLKHQLMQRGVELIVKEFNDHDIRVVLLKGAALSRSIYSDPVCRPSFDIDILVPREHLRKAISILEGKGWRTLQTRMENALQYLHAIGFQSPEKIDLDLHWHVLESRATDQVTESFLERTVSIECFDTQLETLAIEDHLVHVCSHGAVFSPCPQIRWLADVDRIVRLQGNDLDWERVYSMAEKTGTILPLLRTCEWLTREVKTPIPQSILDRLSDARVPTTDSVLFFVSAIKTPGISKFRHRLPVDLLHFLRKQPFNFSRRWFSELQGHLYASNNFLHSPKELFKNWLRIESIKLMHNLLGCLPLWSSDSPNWRNNRDSISRTKESDLHGFHLLECDLKNRLLRWTGPVAGMRLGELRNDVILEIETANCRPDLSNGTNVTFFLNEATLPVDLTSIDAAGVISVHLALPYRPEEGETWVKWKVDTWADASQDPRELGIPVYAIRLTQPEKAEPV